MLIRFYKFCHTSASKKNKLSKSDKSEIAKSKKIEIDKFKHRKLNNDFIVLVKLYLQNNDPDIDILQHQLKP